MAKIGEKFDMFGDATEPRADSPSVREEKSAEPPAVKSPPVRPARAPRAPRVAEVPAEMDKYKKARWRTNLQNAALKVAADRARLDESEQAWADTVAEARAEGVPPNVIVAAAAGADVELPE
jgi:hypothetical protein